ncbi:hypothetical protein MWU49_13430 [Alcanivorax sp. S6407]|nr:hypothetical protein [Alcanivorax sp. S6407]
MSRFLSASLLIQIVLISLFVILGLQSDQAMDKSGVGDLEEWRRLNNLSGAALYGAVILWLASLLSSLLTRTFRSKIAQSAIGVPPLLLVFGWCLLWFV